MSHQTPWRIVTPVQVNSNKFLVNVLLHHGFQLIFVLAQLNSTQTEACLEYFERVFLFLPCHGRRRQMRGRRSKSFPKMSLIFQTNNFTACIVSIIQILLSSGLPLLLFLLRCSSGDVVIGIVLLLLAVNGIILLLLLGPSCSRGRYRPLCVCTVIFIVHGQLCVRVVRSNKWFREALVCGLKKNDHSIPHHDENKIVETHS